MDGLKSTEKSVTEELSGLLLEKLELKDADEKDHAPVLDIEGVITRFEGDLAFLKEAANLFIKDAEKRLASIEKAIKEGQETDLELNAHSLKGSASYIGADRIRGAAHSMEKDAANGDINGAKNHLKVLYKEFENLGNKLNELHWNS